jgi:uncharacterized protein YndB with AHSA1/START domain
MPSVRRERVVQASPADVWEVVADPFHLPRWWPLLARVEDASPRAWTMVLVTPGGKPVRADYTRVEFQPQRRAIWRQELEESPFERIFSSSVTEIELEPAESGATRVAMTVTEKLRGRYRLGGWLVRRAARKRLDQALEGLVRALAPQ